VALTLIRKIAVLAFAAALLSGAASAQTTLTLTTADTQVTDATIGSGTAASTVYNTDVLTTRAASDVNATRRALLKFDTETTIPAGTAITSARLTIYVKRGAGTASRRIGVYPVTKSFQESQATWVIRKTGYAWSTPGGDVGTKAAEASVSSTANAAITVDVTALARQQQLDPSSRYTRILLVDLDAKDSTSFREFYSSETTSLSYRPKLEVVYGSAPPPPPPPAPTGTSLKVLDWNTHYGVGTDGVYNLDRIASKIASLNPDVVSLNEVTRRSHYSSTDDQPAIYAQMLTQKTGRQWYYTYRTDNGQPTGVGNIVLSRFPIASTAYCQLSTRRVAVNAAVHVNGRLINVWSTHLDSSSGNSLRLTEVSMLKSCVSSFAEQKIVAGDFNAQATSTEITNMKAVFVDGWLEADVSPTAAAVDYPGNTRFGATRNSRIDYVFYSKTASQLVLKRAEVFDTRSSTGVMPSDHKPLMITFEVR
jgi:endonuclease/exonuclease/phosphatase family metal-dependent hydrolase